MPYSASPPEPPALITTSPHEVSSLPHAPLVVSNASVSNAAKAEGSTVDPVRMAEALASPVESDTATAKAAMPTAATFVQQAGVSQAALLGTPATTGYRLGRDPQVSVFNPPSQAAGSSPPTPVAVDAARSYLAAFDAPQSVMYAVSGTAEQSSKAAEAAVMSGLSDAIVLDKFAHETLVQEESGTPTKPGLGIRAQATDQPSLLLPLPTLEQPAGDPLPAPTSIPGQPATPPAQPIPTPSTPRSPVNSAPPTGTTPAVGSVIELTADRQEYDELHKVFTAEGKVLMRFQGALLDADRIQVNLENRLAVAEGNVALTRGNQVLRGQRLEYSFVQGTGTVLNARGEIFLPQTGTDLAIGTRGNNEGVTIARPVSDRITAAQPTQGVNSSGSAGFGFGFGRDISRVAGGVPQGGKIRRLRFEADQIDFTPDGWVARNIQITNDPFSPPELVLKAEQATLVRVSPLRDQIRTKRPRLVFDQRVTLPVFVPVITLDRRQRSPALFRLGYDSVERGGLYIERTLNVLSSDTVQFTLTPQFFVQRALSNGGSPFKAENFGFKAALNAIPGPLTSIRARVSFTTLDLNNLENTVRASLRVQQLIGSHILAVEYSYRDRLFNGSLGFQTVQSSLGAVLISPKILLGKSGIELTYQAGFQYVTADTDRLDLLKPNRTNNRVSLGRFEGTVQLARGFTLWQGKALPPTPAEGLRYSPVPLTPYINLVVALRGVASAYTSGDTQQNLIASVALGGQFGHFSRKFFDYTAFNISYIQFVGSGQSPFLFDRAVDTRILSLGITQQLYGPFRIGFQTAINLDSSNQFSTDYILEYSRRTYAIVLRYNPVLSIGAIGLRISDFNWTGGTDTFEGADITPVEGGVLLRRDE